MAIYHLNLATIRRSNGAGCIRSAAYLSGTRLVDAPATTVIGTAAHDSGTALIEPGGRVVDYTDKAVEHSEISVGADMPSWASDRQSLWSSVEGVEKRKDAALAKRLIIALPAELDLPGNTQLTRGFVQDQIVSQGVPCDWAIHVVPDKEGRPQPHAHMQFPSRELTGEGWQKKLRHLDKKPFLRETRQAWSRHANQALERHEHKTRITEKSFKDLGIPLEPTIKVGPGASRREAQGLRSDRIAHNEAVRQRNGERIAAQPEIAVKLAKEGGEPLERVVARHSTAEQFHAIVNRVQSWVAERTRATTAAVQHAAGRQRERVMAAAARMREAAGHAVERVMLLGEEPKVTATRMRLHEERRNGTEARTWGAMRAATGELQQRLRQQSQEGAAERGAAAVKEVTARMERDAERHKLAVAHVLRTRARDQGRGR